VPDRDDWIFAAATVDCEGCVSLSMYGSQAGTLQVIVAMNGPIVDWLHATFGGRIYEYPERPGELQRCRRWIVQGMRSRTFLEGVLPFLKQKRRQCELALAFLETWKGPGPRLTEAERLIRFTLSEEMSLENARWQSVRSS